MRPTDLRPIVIGGGVAGTVAALALQKAGYRPAIFEAYDESAGLAHGVYLTVAVNGIDALRAVDVDDVVRAKGFASNEMAFYSGSGKRLGTLPLGPRLPGGVMTHTIRRADLYDGLYQQARRRGIPIHHGKRLVDAQPLPGGGVVARFDDGSTVEGDVLIGADGVHSVTRGLIDPGNPGPRYTGLGNTGGFARGARISGYPDRPGDYVMVWGRDCFFGYTISPDGEVWWFANPPSRTEPDRTQLAASRDDRLRDQLLTLLRADRTPGADIVRATTGDLRLTNQYDLPTVPTWHNGSMVVIGDAAHAVSPSSGQGASLAAEDAVVLAQCLRDLPSIPQALDRYEQLRRHRVERVVSWASGMNNTKKQGLIGRLLRDIAVPVILRHAARPAELDKMSWLFTHHVEWDTPVPSGPVPVC